MAERPLAARTVDLREVVDDLETHAADEVRPAGEPLDDRYDLLEGEPDDLVVEAEPFGDLPAAGRSAMHRAAEHRDVEARRELEHPEVFFARERSLAEVLACDRGHRITVDARNDDVEVGRVLRLTGLLVEGLGGERDPIRPVRPGEPDGDEIVEIGIGIDDRHEDAGGRLSGRLLDASAQPEYRATHH